jgi:hypothetical protein
MSNSYKSILDGPFQFTPEHRAAVFMDASNKAEASCSDFLEFLYQEVQGARKHTILADERWMQICNHLVKDFVKISSSEINWHEVYARLISLQKAGLNFASAELGEIAFNAEEFEDALRIWGELDKKEYNRKKYNIAKTQTTSYPESLKWYNELNDFKQIINLWERNQVIDLTSEYQRYVYDACINEKDFQMGIIFLEKYPEEERLDSLLDKILDTNEMKLVQRVARQLLIYKANTGRWREAIEFVSDSTFPKSIRLKLHAWLVYEAAVSDTLPKEVRGEKSAVEEYLRELLVESAWRNLVTVKIAGAAIEKAGRIVDALKFYESIWQSNQITADKRDRQFAQERWLKCKIKQAQWSESNNNVGDARTQRQDAERRSRIWKINLRDLSLYPVIEMDIQFDEQVENFGDDQSDEDKIDIQFDEQVESLSDDQLEAVQELTAIGWTAERIAAALGLKKFTVEKIQEK